MILLTDIVISSPLPLHEHLVDNPRLSLGLIIGAAVDKETSFATGDLGNGEWRMESSLHVSEADGSFTLAVIMDKQGRKKQFVLETPSFPDLFMRVEMQPEERLRFATSNNQLIEFTVAVSLKSLSSHENLEAFYAAIHRMVDRDIQARELNTIGWAYHTLFQKKGSMADLEKAVSIHEEVIQLTPASHSQYAKHSSGLGITLHSRFYCNGNLADIEHATSLCQQAVDVASDANPEIATLLDNLGLCLMSRFERLGALADLDGAISARQKAVDLAPDGHRSEVPKLNGLGSALHLRFERLGSLVDLERSISLKQSAVDLTPDNQLNKPVLLASLGSSLYTRFQRLGGLADLHRAISIEQRAVDLTPDSHPEKPFLISRLGDALEARYQRLGDIFDLEKATTLNQLASNLTPDNHPNKPSILASLGNSLQLRFERLGDVADLDQAISLKQRAVDLTPDGHPSKPPLVSSLGDDLTAQYQCFGDLKVLEQAIMLNQLASDLTPDNHPNKSSILASLGNSLEMRFERLGDIADLDQAILVKQTAVGLTPDGHPVKPFLFSRLSNALQNRYKRLGDLKDLDRAIILNQLASDLTPDGHPNKPPLLGNLGISLKLRFDRLGDLADLDQAIFIQQSKVDMVPDGHPEKSTLLCGLGISLQARFESTKMPSDIQNATLAFSRAATSSTGPPVRRFQAARLWASALTIRSGSPLPAFSCAINLLPRIAWLGLALTNQHALIGHVGDIVHEAVAAAVQFEEYETAVEWTEQGRAIVWQNMINLRDPLDELHNARPELAVRLQHVSQELQDLVSANNSSGVVSFAEINRESSQLAIEWDNTVEEIRKLPNFQSFLAAKSFNKLGSTAYEGPVVILNVHESRCDALVLLPDNSEDRKASVIHIPLEAFSYETAQELSRNVSSLLSSAGVRAREVQKEERVGYSVTENDAKFKEILGTLWLLVAKPIIDALAYQTESRDPPRIWWCATGPLSFLPIHAAGIYDTATVGEKLSDYVVSSYTTTLTTLLERSRPAEQSDFQILTVSQPSLPGTEDEVRRIERLASDILVAILARENATVENVLQGMSESNWIHLACHGQQNKEASMESGFLLHDRILELSEIIRAPLPKAEFAFLSACQTATGDERITEESVHLAAGMLFAGCRSVIATMWSIKDDDAPQVVEDVYSRMLKGGQSNREEAARALHEAVKRLRDSGAGFLSWVPFIHIGR